MVKASSKQKSGSKISANDLRQDLKDFKATKKSIQALMKVKKSNQSAENGTELEKQALKSVEDKAKLALDKLFTAKKKK